MIGTVRRANHAKPNFAPLPTAACAGMWWAHQHEDVRADLLLFAKGIASGFPTGGVAVEPRHVARMTPGMLGGTFGGGSMAHAAIHATIAAIEKEGMLANAAERGAQLAEGLRALERQGAPIRDVRGVGLMLAVEFDAPPAVAAQVRTSAGLK